MDIAKSINAILHPKGVDVDARGMPMSDVKITDSGLNARGGYTGKKRIPPPQYR